MNFSALFTQMLVLFGILLIGYYTAKRGVLTRDMNKHLSTLVCMLTNPLQVLASALSGEHPMENAQVLGMTGVALAMFVVLILISFLVPRALRIQSACTATCSCSPTSDSWATPSLRRCLDLRMCFTPRFL